MEKTKIYQVCNDLVHVDYRGKTVVDSTEVFAEAPTEAEAKSIIRRAVERDGEYAKALYVRLKPNQEATA